MSMSQYVEHKDMWLTRFPRCSNLKSNNVKGTIFQRRLVLLARGHVGFSSFWDSERGEVSALAIILPSLVLASFLTTSLLTTSALSPTISTHSRSPLKSPFYVPQYACLQPMSCCLAPFSLSVRLSCPSVLTLSPWLSSCDTWRCPTVHWCSHLSHLRMARYLFHLIPHFSFGVSDFWSFFYFTSTCLYQRKKCQGRLWWSDLQWWRLQEEMMIHLL